MADQKIFSGAQVRRLRVERGLTQAQMAHELGISTTYLNLIERNQRPLTAQMLLRLAESYDVDVKAFSGSEEAHLASSLQEVFADPLLKAHEVGHQAIRDIARTEPALCHAIVRLYRGYRAGAENAAELANQLTDDKGGVLETLRLPAEDVRDFLRARTNYFAEMESAADSLSATRARSDDLYTHLARHLAAKHRVELRIEPIGSMRNMLRWYDRHRRVLHLSEMLGPSGRVFQLAFQVAMLGYRELLDGLVTSGHFAEAETEKLARAHLANYFAAALMMPYDTFLATAEELRYDIEVLSARFGASFEQVCHRLTTLQRPSARGVPFFMIRLDKAGNVSKRFSAGTFRFAQLGGACPRWNVHDAFRYPGRILTQKIAMPDGTTYFSIARTVERTGTGFHQTPPQLAIGLGCEIAYAPRLVYADGMNAKSKMLATPIGINCRHCERTDCTERAFAPLNRRLLVDEFRRYFSAITFYDT
jgi:predicted transcriptional regulator/DNA-binding XRE family transcriptional regulator